MHVKLVDNTSKKLTWALIRDKEGASAVEYAVLLALIIAVCIVVIWGVGNQVNNAFDKASKEWIKASAAS